MFSLTKIFPYTVLVDCYIRVFEELAGAIDRQFWLISYLNSYTTKKLKNKAILSCKNIVCIALWLEWAFCLGIFVFNTVHGKILVG